MSEPVSPSRRCDLADAEATRALGARFAAALEAPGAAREAPVLVTLSGDLGAGKTTFVGGLLAALGHAGPVRSPTYTLVEPYRFGAREVVHCDLYRLRHPDELEDLGLRELMTPGTLLLVEWPEKAEGRLPRTDIAIVLRYAGTDARTAELAAGTELGAALVGSL